MAHAYIFKTLFCCSSFFALFARLAVAEMIHDKLDTRTRLQKKCIREREKEFLGSKLNDAVLIILLCGDTFCVSWDREKKKNM